MSIVKGLLVAFAALIMAGTAHATPAEYIFTGTGTGTLGGTAFDGDFTITLNGDTSGISSGGGEFTNAVTGTFSDGSTTTTFTGTMEVLVNIAAPGFMGFAETAPTFAIEATINSAFETYALDTSLALTIGTPSFLASTGMYDTAAGTLAFATMSALDFQAEVPEPASLAVLSTALLGFEALRRRRRRRR
jgi:hypothetical protein